MLSRPENSRQPYILSALDEEDPGAHAKKWRAYAAIGAAFMLFSLALVMYSDARAAGDLNPPARSGGL